MSVSLMKFMASVQNCLSLTHQIAMWYLQKSIRKYAHDMQKFLM